MDYSPTPNKVKPQYAFLDNSIELGRSAAAPRAFRGSPLKNQKDTETFHQKQKQFYNKYTDLGGTPDILKEKQRARAGQNYTDTTLRLFKNISNKVPVDDVVKINSNMIEKIIRENENLKNELKESRREIELLNQFAKGAKEKIIKYKDQNDVLIADVEKLKCENLELEKKLKLSTPPESPKYNFDPNDVQDIFGSNEKASETPIVEEINNNSNNTGVAATSKIEERIINLEGEVSKINANQDEKFEYIKNEIEFLKNLSLQMNEKPNEDPSKEETESDIPKEDDLIVKESLELKQLQEQVDLFTKKLQLREENKLKKYTLNKELEKLAQQLQQDEVPNKDVQEPIVQEEVHTPINQTSPSSSTKTSKPSSHKKTSSVRERLSSECKVCDKAPETPQETTANDNAKPAREHIPSFKIGDTVWY